MATDYDAPRRRADDDLDDDSFEGLKARERTAATDDDDEIVDSFELPAMDLASEELNITVVPRRADEFTCGSCFLVQRRNRIDHVEDDGSIICQDCA